MGNYLVKKITIDDNYYRGETINAVPHGKGILYDKKMKKEYKGEWLNGKYHGYGVLYYDNGNKKYKRKMVRW